MGLVNNVTRFEEFKLTPEYERQQYGSKLISKWVPGTPRIMKKIPAKMNFNKREIDPLYALGIELKDNSLSKEELVTKISCLRAGSFIDVVTAFRVIATVIILLTTGWVYHFNPIQMV